VTPVPIRRAARAACTLLAATAAVASLAAPTREAAAQTWPTTDPVLRRIWTLGMDSSQTYPLMQALTDSIGPRLTGTPGIQRGHDWLVRTYGAWGVPARNERVGTWKGWRRGVTHVDLVSPRVRTLEGTMLAWSPGTRGRDGHGTRRHPPRRGRQRRLPRRAAERARAVRARQSGAAELPPRRELGEVGAPRDARAPQGAPRLGDTALAAARAPHRARAVARHRLARPRARGRRRRRRDRLALERGVGACRRSSSRATRRRPALDLACEDYTLLYRLAERGQAPVVRLRADAEFTGEAPTFNTVAEIKGSERPNE
jgi:hypothetical protein